MGTLHWHETPEYTAAASVYPYSDAIRKNYLTASRYGEPLELFKVVGGRIHVPRASAPWGEDRTSSGAAHDVTAHVVPRNVEQARVIEEGRNLLDAGESFIVESPTGTGKTVIGVDWLCRSGVTTLVVSTKLDILRQWRDSLVKFSDMSLGDVGYAHGNRFQVKGKPVVLGTVHSLSKEGRYPEWFYHRFGLILFDEVHRLGAEQFSEVCWRFTARQRIGLSATVDRKDGKEVIFKAHIGEVRVKSEALLMIPKVLRVHSGWMIPMVRASDGSMKPMPHSHTRNGHVLKAMVHNKARADLVAKCVANAFHKGRWVVCFSERRDYLDAIADRIKGRGVPHGRIGWYVGGMTEGELRKASGNPVLMATYGAVGEGTDLPWYDTAVLATPRANAAQNAGRILREYDNKKQPVVIDIVDTSSYVYAGYAKSRLAWYNKVKAEVIEM